MHVLTSLDALEAVLASAASDPVLFFKHSETCGMSLQAHHEMRELVADRQWAVPVYLVSVQASRALSTEMAARFGVRHASPQVMLVRDGVVQWHTSHLAITVSAIQAAVDRVTKDA